MKKRKPAPRLLRLIPPVFAALALMLTVSPARAAIGAWATADHIKAHVFSDGLAAGLQVHLAPGWHMYWKRPGEGGLPPRLDTTGSQNLKSVEIIWPTPARFDEGGLQTFGYVNNMIFPLTVTPETEGAPVVLNIKAEIMVCSDICIPQTLTLPPHMLDPAEKDPVAAAMLQSARRELPAAGDQPFMRIDTAVLGPQALVLRAYSERGFPGADVFVDAGEDLYVTAVPVIVPDEKDGRQAMITVAAPAGVDNLAQALSGRTVKVILWARGRAIEKSFDF